MTTRGEAAKAEAAKKGIAVKRAKKLGQRKQSKTNRTEAKVVKAPRTKRDTAAVLAHEAQANSPDARAERAKSKVRRVRGSAQK